MDDMGNLTITFSEEMNGNYSLKFLNETFIKIYVKAKNETGITRNLNLTWNIISFEGKDLKINIKFEKPLEISIRKHADRIVFERLVRGWNGISFSEHP
jgi:hypothetical protein